MNANQIRPNLWLGSKESAKYRQWLVANHIQQILNVATNCEDPDLMIPVVKVPLIDGPGNEQIAVDAAVCILCEMLVNGKNTLVHCVAGHSRSAYVCARALARFESRDYDDVYTELRGLRPEVIWPEYMRPLYGI